MGIFSSKEDILGKKRSDSNKDACKSSFQAVLIFSQMPGWVSAANHGDLPSDRDAVTCQEYLENFSPAMFELTQYEIFALWTKKGNFMGTVHPNKIEQTACVLFFFPVFSRMKLRSGSKQTTVTAWKVYCRWFYICH